MRGKSRAALSMDHTREPCATQLEWWMTEQQNGGNSADEFEFEDCTRGDRWQNLSR